MDDKRMAQILTHHLWAQTLAEVEAGGGLAVAGRARLAGGARVAVGALAHLDGGRLDARHPVEGGGGGEEVVAAVQGDAAQRRQVLAVAGEGGADAQGLQVAQGHQEAGPVHGAVVRESPEVILVVMGVLVFS